MLVVFLTYPLIYRAEVRRVASLETYDVPHASIPSKKGRHKGNRTAVSCQCQKLLCHPGSSARLRLSRPGRCLLVCRRGRDALQPAGVTAAVEALERMR